VLDESPSTTAVLSVGCGADVLPHEPDDAYEHILPHLMFDWSILLVFCIVCVGLSALSLRASLKR